MIYMEGTHKQQCDYLTKLQAQCVHIHQRLQTAHFIKWTQLICIANYSLLCLDTNNLGLHNVIVSVWFQNGVYKHVCFCMLTSRACCILSFWAMFGREEQKLVLFSKICPPNRLSSGKRVSLHRHRCHPCRTSAIRYKQSPYDIHTHEKYTQTRVEFTVWVKSGR